MDTLEQYFPPFPGTSPFGNLMKARDLCPNKLHIHTQSHDICMQLGRLDRTFQKPTHGATDTHVTTHSPREVMHFHCRDVLSLKEGSSSSARQLSACPLPREAFEQWEHTLSPDLSHL